MRATVCCPCRIDPTLLMTAMQPPDIPVWHRTRHRAAQQPQHQLGVGWMPHVCDAVQTHRLKCGCRWRETLGTREHLPRQRCWLRGGLPCPVTGMRSALTLLCASTFRWMAAASHHLAVCNQAQVDAPLPAITPLCALDGLLPAITLLCASKPEVMCRCLHQSCALLAEDASSGAGCSCLEICIAEISFVQPQHAAHSCNAMQSPWASCLFCLPDAGLTCQLQASSSGYQQSCS